MNGPVFNNTLKCTITIFALAFNAAIIVVCVWKGDGANSLDSSALGWSYVMGAGILVGLGIGALTPTIADIFKRNP